MMKLLLKKLFMPSLLIGFSSFLYLFFKLEYEILNGFINLNLLILIILWMSITSFINRIIIYFFYKVYLSEKLKSEVPSLLENFSTLLIWLLSLFLYLYNIHGYGLTGLWATSSVTIAVLGFALKGLVMDFFSGLAMGIERPFVIGDWIRVDEKLTGKVIAMNWRVTRIVSSDNVVSVIPNSLLSTISFQNFSKEEYIRDELEIELDYDITAHRAERILLGAANELNNSIDPLHKPDTRISQFTPRGVKWKVRFWFDDFENRSLIKYEIQKNILRNLHFSGTNVSREKLDLLGRNKKNSKIRVSDLVFLLKSISFFNSLTEEEILTLSKSSKKRLIYADTDVIKYGEEGDSLFILLEGSLSVHIPLNGKEKEVAKIRAGDFFGEMSLLTKEPRSATIKSDVDSIIYEISHDNLKEILQNRNEIIDSLSEYLEKRVNANKKELSKNSSIKKEDKNNFTDILKKLFSV